jgi:hypothetical protein
MLAVITFTSDKYLGLIDEVQRGPEGYTTEGRG